MRLLLAAFLCSTAALGAPAHLGLYPLSLPKGQEQLADRLAAQLHEGAAALPGVRAFDLVAHSACAPEETACLAAAARRAGLEAMLSAEVNASDSGYRFALREVSAEGALVAEKRGEVRGGPLDLLGALEHGVCEVLGGAPCEGELRIASGSAERGLHVSVDGVDRGGLPLSLRVPVGRHAVGLGGAEERRVRVSYARTVRLTAATRAGALALLDEADAPAPLAAVPSLSGAPADGSRARASRVLFISGLSLLSAAGGVVLYAHSTAPKGPGAGYTAAALAATGAGAIAAGGLLFVLTPEGAAVSGRF